MYQNGVGLVNAITVIPLRMSKKLTRPIVLCGLRQL
jgi:hypothetical protein